MLKTINISVRILKLVIFIAGIFIFNSVQGQTINADQLNPREKKIFEEAKSMAKTKKIDKSIDAYIKLLRLRPDFIEGHLRLGSQYYLAKDYAHAEDAFIKAIELDSTYDPEMYYSLAQAEISLYKYLSAADHLDKYIQTSTNTKKVEKSEKTRDDLRFIDDAMKHPVPFKPIDAGPVINTYNSEYAPLISVDGQFLIFTRNIKAPGDFIGQEDIFVARRDSSEWIDLIPMSGVNTIQNEGAFAISGSGNYIVFTACDRKDSYGSCDLYYSMFMDDQWTRPVNMGKVINSATWDSHPTLSVDGRMMIFASRRKGSIGGSDLWITQKDDKGSWITPQNLGPVINTKGDDESPFLHPDGQTLYFRSNGRPGMGNFDIYYSRFNKSENTWSEPKNLGFPINTEGNEGSMTVSLDGKTAWYASDKDYLNDKMLNNLNIYSFELYEHARPVKTTYVKGFVSDINTKKPLSSNVKIVDLSSENTIFMVETTNDGYFVAALPSGGQYACKVEADQYVFYSKYFDLNNESFNLLPYILDVELTPIVKNVDKKEEHSMVLNNIFFDSGSSTLQEKSNFEINNIVKMMLEHPTMVIKIVGYTDNVGSDQDNLLLSQVRAKAVVDALINKGIQEERIKYEGKGSAEPVADNLTEQGRSQNRRTELIFLEF